MFLKKVPTYIQRLTRLQIIQTPLLILLEKNPNFRERRFRYLEGGFPRKWINIAAYNWVSSGALPLAFGT